MGQYNILCVCFRLSIGSSDLIKNLDEFLKQVRQNVEQKEKPVASPCSVQDNKTSSTEAPETRQETESSNALPHQAVTFSSISEPKSDALPQNNAGEHKKPTVKTASNKLSQGTPVMQQVSKAPSQTNTPNKESLNTVLPKVPAQIMKKSVTVKANKKVSTKLPNTTAASKVATASNKKVVSTTPTKSASKTVPAKTTTPLVCTYLI